MANERYILVVDDEEVIVQMILKRILMDETSALQPLVAADGYEALEAMETKDVAVVVLDLQMRNMDGMAVCRKVKTTPELQNIPIIISSGFLNPEKKEQLEGMGIKYFLDKPYQLRDLFQLINEILGLEK